MENLDYIKRSERDTLNLFWIGFVLYMASYTISMSEQVNYIVCQFFQLIGLIMLVVTAFRLVRFKIDNAYFQVIFTLYFLWLLTLIFRGFRADYESIKLMFFDAWFGLLPYFTPLIVLFPKKLLYYKKVINVIAVLACIFLVYDFIFISDLVNSDIKNLRSQTIVEYFSRTLGITSLFILFTYRYHSHRLRYLAVFVVTLIIWFALVRARRSLLATTLIAVVFAYLLYLQESNQKLSIILFSVFTGIILLFFGIEFFEANKEGLFKSIMERGLADTRSGVENCFMKDMGVKDWIIGRGMNGEYFCPGFEVSDVTGYRDVIETDYLQTILKGGLISLGLFLLIAIPAMFKGIFYSNNLLAKAAGFWIFYVLLNMYPASMNTFTMQYVLVWICIGICYSKEIRHISKKRMSAYFKTPNHNPKSQN